MTPAQAEIVEHITEKALTDMVIAQARALGWLVYHTHDSRRSAPGFPDIVAIRGDVLLVAELKREKKFKITVEQRRWLAAFDRVARTEVWHPRHWLSGEIEAVLRGDA